MAASGLTPELVVDALHLLLPEGTALPTLAKSKLMEVRHLRLLPPAHRAHRLLVLVRQAVGEIDDGSWHRAALALFGLTPGTFRKSLADRRLLASEAFFVSPHTYRRDYERRLVEEVGWRLAFLLDLEFLDRSGDVQLTLFADDAET